MKTKISLNKTTLKTLVLKTNIKAGASGIASCMRTCGGISGC
jgi:hypothetical protein